MSARATGGAYGLRRAQFSTGGSPGRLNFFANYSYFEQDGYRDQSWLDAWNYYATIEHYGRRSTTRLVLFGGASLFEADDVEAIRTRRVSFALMYGKIWFNLIKIKLAMNLKQP